MHPKVERATLASPLLAGVSSPYDFVAPVVIGIKKHGRNGMDVLNVACILLVRKEIHRKA